MFDTHITMLVIPPVTVSPVMERHIGPALAAAKEARQIKREAARQARLDRKSELLNTLDEEEADCADQNRALACLFGR